MIAVAVAPPPPFFLLASVSAAAPGPGRVPVDLLSMLAPASLVGALVDVTRTLVGEIAVILDATVVSVDLVETFTACVAAAAAAAGVVVIGFATAAAVTAFSQFLPA